MLISDAHTLTDTRFTYFACALSVALISVVVRVLLGLDLPYYLSHPSPMSKTTTTPTDILIPQTTALHPLAF